MQTTRASARVERLEDGVGRAGRRHEDAAGVRARGLHGLGDGVEDRRPWPSNFSPPRPGVTPATTWVPYSSICLAWKPPGAAGDALHEQARVLADEDAHFPHLPPRRRTFSRAVGHGRGRLDGEAALGQDLPTQLHVRPLEPHDQRHPQAELLGRGDDAGGDDVALHDAAEDVDEDGLHLGALQDDLEGLGDLLLVGAAADVEEVRRGDAAASRRSA